MNLTETPLLARAKTRLVGGVNSPVRSFRAVGSDPLFIEKGEGPYIIDNSGKAYIDFQMGFGPLLMGHAHPYWKDALHSALEKGALFGTPTEKEVEFAELVHEFCPSLEKMRFLSSGTEAVMTALRLARGHTGRKGLIKFKGCFHGHLDALLVEAGSGCLTHAAPGKPSSLGIPEEVTATTYLLEFNDEEALEKLFETHGHTLAACILEPIAGNMGLVLPTPRFLQKIRTLTEKYGTVLIFDEIITGFHCRLGTVAESYGITPDLTTLGKVTGGGLPLGILGGKKEIMEGLAPEGGVYQAGTFSGNPLTMASGIAMLTYLKNHPEEFEDCLKRSSWFFEELRKRLPKFPYPAFLQTSGVMFTLFFHRGPVLNYQDVKECDTEAFGKFFKHMLESGIYLPPSQFETCFISLVHTEKELNRTLEAIDAFCAG